MNLKNLIKLKSSAIARSNIAFIKYWGRSLENDPNLKMPANDSISMTKQGLKDETRLQTHTTIEFSDAYNEDIAILDREILIGRGIERVLNTVEPLRRLAKIDYKFKMMSRNDFPTQAGLASSASAFAALAIATADALGLQFSKEEISTYARLGSGSAARSIHGGFVWWHKGNSHETSYAEQICGPKKVDIAGVIAIILEEKKDVTSEAGHDSAWTSPFNEVRVKKSQEQAGEMREAILNNDFSRIGQIAEENCKSMHAIMMTSTPSLFYWHPNTLRVIKAIQRMRKEGLECYFTIDAGPNVHCLCRPENMYEVEKLLEKIEGVIKTIPISPGDDSYVTKEHLF